MRQIVNKTLYTISVVSTALLLLAFILSYQNALAEDSDQIQTLIDQHSMPTEVAQVIRPATTGELQAATVKPTVTNKVTTTNRLVVPKMKVDGAILEGKTTKTLNQGLWHIPGTSTPDKGGNMVVAAHRWMLLPQSGKSFYDIEKVKEGDEISLTWNGKDYKYKVGSTEYVKPTDVHILQNTSNTQLTLFSCAPLFSTKYRYVVHAELLET